VSSTQPITRSASHARREYALLIALSTLWGASYTFIRIGVATVPPLTFIAARTLIAGALLAAWMVARNIALPRDPALWRRFLVQSLLNSVMPFTLIAWGEQSLDAGVAIILNSASPVFTVLATWLVTRHEAVTLRKVGGVIAGLAGICVIVGPSVVNQFGDQALPQLAIVAATICYSGAAIYGRSFHGLSPVVPAAASMLLGAALLIPASLMFDHPWTLHPSQASLVALLALAVFSTALAFVIYFRLIQTLGSIVATTQAYLRVPIGVALSAIFLGEALTPSAWTGMACVVAGVAAMAMPERTMSARQQAHDGRQRRGDGPGPV
jgi:drug/metabolite transporter (DMT)-like permease